MNHLITPHGGTLVNFIVDTTHLTPDEAAQEMLLFLEMERYIR